MTITEKILAAHASKDRVYPGELINVRLDLVLGNDITAPVGIEEFKKIGAEKVFDKSKVVLVPDHFTPNKDINSAEQAKIVRDFALDQEIEHYFEVGRMGIEHALLPEQGLVLPGDVVIGADSHTCTYGALGAFATGVGSTDMAAGMATGEAWFRVPETTKFVYKGELGKWVRGKDLILYTIGKIGVDGALYKAMEFTGEIIKGLSMDSRLSMTNMAIEAGGKNGIIAPDDITLDYVRPRAKRDFKIFQSDEGAEYAEVLEFNGADIELQVAFPHLPSKTKGISDVGDVRIDQVFIGSCTNGKIEDLRIAAKVLRGKKVHDKTRLVVVPATEQIYHEMLQEGLAEVFHEAGASIGPPTCGACFGAHMGVLAENEVGVFTTNRNFVGRNGHASAQVYLVSPAVAAATAIRGRICDPRELLS